MPDVTPIQTEKKILIAKKFVLSRRLLAKVLDNLGYDYDILDDVTMLESQLDTGNYDTLFIDASLVSDNISSAYGNIAIISTFDSKDPQEVHVTKGESIANTSTKEEINEIIKKYRG
jgi:hypothetical protein